MKARSVRIIYMKHDGESKDYHYILLKDRDTDTAELLTRWGKVGAAGQTRGLSVSDIKSIESLLNKEIKKRMTRGYAIISTRVYEDPTEMAIDGEPGMVSISKNTALARKLDGFLANNLKMKVLSDDEFFELPETKPEIEIERGELWGSW